MSYLKKSSAGSLASFRIDRADFVKGNNSYDDVPDGGILKSNYGANPFSKPGLISIVPDLGAVVTNSLPAAGTINFGQGKGASASTAMALGINNSEDGYFYTIDSATGNFVIVGSADTTNDFQASKSDTVFYQGNFYTTSTDDIVKNSVDLATRDVSYWVTTKGQPALNSSSPHPMVVFGDINYIADGQYLHQDDGGTVTTQVFNLGSDWVITSMVVYNNLIYICAEPYFNSSASNHGLAKMFTWDGYSEHWLDEWFVDNRVDAMHVFENILYMWTKQYMSYWDGARSHPIYATNGQQTFKHMITECDRSMFFVDNNFLVRYGAPVFGAGKRFFNWQKNILNGNLTAILSWETNALIVTKSGNSNGANYYIQNVNAPSTINSNQYIPFNPRYFRTPVHIRKIVVETQALASGQLVEVDYTDDAGNTYVIGTFDNATSDMVGKTRWEFDVFGKPITRSCGVAILPKNATYIRSVDVFYEASENQLNK